jgi:hypothetical protein
MKPQYCNQQHNKRSPRRNPTKTMLKILNNVFDRKKKVNRSNERNFKYNSMFYEEGYEYFDQSFPNDDDDVW